MAEPRQKPGKSRQDYATPPEFIAAVVERFGPLAWDLAADAKNHKAPSYYTAERDSLAQDWTCLRGTLWLNPPFGDIAPWARKCRASMPFFPVGTRIVMLTPASIGSCWFAEHVHGHALVMGISPRLSFDGKNSYPKDLALMVYGQTPGFDVWRWK
jgi:phage N-6-adenine-methyltransferase